MMEIEDVYIGQRVRIKEGLSLFARGCREGDVYHIGRRLVSVEFDYLGTVASIQPDDLEPVE